VNFKIRVVENIGVHSLFVFGEPGTVFEVLDGEFRDKKHHLWNQGGLKYRGFKEVDKDFSVIDEFQTKFELVEDNP
jgi:hypothetical protein